MFDEQPDRFVQKASLGARLIMPAACVAGMVAIGFVGVWLLKPSGSPVARPHQEPHITHIQLPPPPPPPPLKPPPEPPKKTMEKPKEQAPSPMKASVPKAAPKVAAPPSAVTTSITGPGGSLAAGNGGGGDCIGSGCGTGDGGGGDNDAYYANVIQSQTLAALRQDDKLRFAKYHVKVAVVLDGSGHIVTATVQSFTGNPGIEQEVRRVLLTVGTNDTPPADVTRKTFTVSITEHA